MILVIPALEIHDGKCNYCIKGERGTENLYENLSSHPDMLCRLFRRENAKSLHITDYDSLNNQSHDNIDQIIRFGKSVDIPFEVLGNYSSPDLCRRMLDNGIYRVILSDITNFPKTEISNLLKQYTPSRLAFFVDACLDQVKFKTIGQNLDSLDYAFYLKALGASRIVYSDMEKCLSGFDSYLAKAAQIASKTNLRLTLFEAVTNFPQLQKVQGHLRDGIDSVIIGKALYENNFPCQKIWRLIEADLEPSIN